jgi:DNA polymerase-3 subunit delta
MVKISSARADAYVRKPDGTIRAVLVYGPDAGLVRERAETLVKSVAGSLDDPFRTREVTLGDLKDDPALLRDEANALSLTGGRRAVRLRNATDSLAPLLEELLADATAVGALVVIEAGNLASRSTLRTLFEENPAAAAIACYLDDDSTLSDVIEQSLRQRGLSVAPDALEFLTSQLGGDRMITRSELDKLALYAAERKTVTLEDAEACIGDSSERGIDDLAAALTAGDQALLDRTYARVLHEGANPIQILRLMQRHFERLHYVAGKAAGGNVDAVMKTLRPPVFFKAVPAFKAALRQWPTERIGQAMELLLKAEMDCKTTGMPSELICGRVLMQIAGAARRSAQARS